MATGGANRIHWEPLLDDSILAAIIVDDATSLASRENDGAALAFSHTECA
jgi:hypothetical protein